MAAWKSRRTGRSAKTTAIYWLDVKMQAGPIPFRLPGCTRRWYDGGRRATPRTRLHGQRRFSGLIFMMRRLASGRNLEKRQRVWARSMARRSTRTTFQGIYRLSPSGAGRH